MRTIEIVRTTPEATLKARLEAIKEINSCADAYVEVNTWARMFAGQFIEDGKPSSFEDTYGYAELYAAARNRWLTLYEKEIA